VSPEGVLEPRTAPAGRRGTTASARRRHRRRAALIAVAALAVVALALARTLVAEPFRVPSASMEPTLRPGDSVLVDKLAGAPHRGQLVAFHVPGSTDVLLKRVAGTTGDTVAIEDGVLVVDDRRLHEPYYDPKSLDSVYFGPFRVRRGTVFVLGDNRANSEDSRTFGAIPTRDIIGVAVAIVWPPDRWRGLR
jgi:signal peptidase I